MKKLNGFLGTDPKHLEPGQTIGQQGELYNILDFDANAPFVHIDWIARSLAKQCRYIGNIGHTNHIFSVAQHCVMGAQAFILMGEVDLAYDFLNHENAEAFLGDDSAPKKRLIGSILKPIEAAIEQRLAKRFGFRYPFPKEVKEMDNNICSYELTFMADEPEMFSDYWSVEKSYSMFIETYNQIQLLKAYQLGKERQFHYPLYLDENKIFKDNFFL